MKYVVYLTMYKGSKLPTWYIGSSSIERIKSGYNGSVVSKKWGEIYKNEQKKNKHLFKTRILSSHQTKKEALVEELRLQRMHKVVLNENYMNKAYACKNGFQGGDTSWAIDYEKIKKNFDFSKHCVRSNQTINEKRKNDVEYDKKFRELQGNRFRGRNHSKSAREKISKASSQNQRGSKNSQFGMIWIYNSDLKENRTIHNTEMIPEGWSKGRKMSFYK